MRNTPASGSILNEVQISSAMSFVAVAVRHKILQTASRVYVSSIHRVSRSIVDSAIRLSSRVGDTYRRTKDAGKERGDSDYPVSIFVCHDDSV